jgi:hypothetical protein
LLNSKSLDQFKESQMKKLVVAGLVMALGLAPAFALAQTSGGGTSGQSTTGNAGTSNSGSDTSTTPNTAPTRQPNDHAPVPGSYTGGSSPMPSTITNKAECERAGGKWHDVENKCGL